jgi:transcriptional regulator with XRE-family HTH domain
MAQLVDAAGGQNALARISGVTQASISRYLKGVDPSREALVKLAESSGFSVEWLATGDGPKKRLPRMLTRPDSSPEIETAEGLWVALRWEHTTYHDSRSGDWEQGFVRAMEIVAQYLRPKVDIPGFARARRIELESAGLPLSRRPRSSQR